MGHGRAPSILTVRDAHQGLSIENIKTRIYMISNDLDYNQWLLINHCVWQ